MPHEILCFSMCPCCMPPLCGPAGGGGRRDGYARLLRTAAFWFSALQLALCCASLHWRGLAPSAVNPMLGPWADVLDLMQAKNSAAIRYRWELWRLLTPVFLHAGFLHLAANLLMQLRVGLYVEQLWGTAAFTGIYLATGVYATAASAVLRPAQISVGASGALMGVLGGWTAWLLLHWADGGEGHQQQRAAQLVMAVVTISVTMGFSFVPNTDWVAHLGGLVAGLLLGVAAFARQRGARAAAAGGYAASLVGALAWLFTQTEPPVQLLAFCTDVVKPAYPEYDLTCFGN
jgi:membrane associated rhomboid family serine protease